jgi:hypothetical protein
VDHRDRNRTLAQNTEHPITPLRAEGQGALSWISFLLHFCQFHKIWSTTTIMSYTDCESLLPYLTTSPLEKKQRCPLKAEFDVLSSIHVLFGKLSHRCTSLATGAHVQAHQKPPFPSRQAQLNHQCDINAKAAQIQYQPSAVNQITLCQAYSHHEAPPSLETPKLLADGNGGTNC